MEFAWRAPEEEEACFDAEKGDGDANIFFDDNDGDGDGDGHIRRRLARRSRAVPREKAVPSTPLVYVLEARRVPTRDTASIASKAGAGSGASFGAPVSSPLPSPKKKKKKRASSDDDSDAAGWIVVYRGFDARATVSGLDPGETIRARVRAGERRRVWSAFRTARVSNARRASRPAGGALLLANHARVGQGTMASADET